VKRGGKTIKDGKNLFLNMMVEDDTDSIICTVNRFNYQSMGKPIVETGKEGRDYYMIKGQVKHGWRKIHVKKIKRLTDSEGNTIISDMKEIIDRKKEKERQIAEDVTEHKVFAEPMAEG